MLRDQTASLVGSLASANVRGAWGEVTLRRVLEVSGLLARCDFDEQWTGVTMSGAAVRPDVVVHLPGERHLAVDAKAPMTDFLAAQADGLTAAERAKHLRAHARSLRGHVDALASKGYWTAFEGSPEIVVCFVPGEALLAAALSADPQLHEHAMARSVVLASPATLLALLRSVALAWRQDALADGARELLTLGQDLYARLGAVGRHTEALGASLRKSVEAYNVFVGSMESRVLVTARRMRGTPAADGCRALGRAGRRSGARWAHPSDIGRPRRFRGAPWPRVDRDCSRLTTVARTNGRRKAQCRRVSAGGRASAGWNRAGSVLGRRRSGP